MAVLIAVSWCKEMHFFSPIHHFDQIETKMDLFLMKLLLIKSPRTLQQSRVGEPGAEGSLEGRGKHTDLGLVVFQQRELGLCPGNKAMGRSWGSQYPDLSSWCSCFQFPPPSHHLPLPLVSLPEAWAHPCRTGLLSAPRAVLFCHQLVNESVGSGAMACHLLEVGSPL